MPSARELAEWVDDARRRTFALVEELSDEQLLETRVPIVNPLLWEIGHVGWFQEKWVLRHAGRQRPIRANADALYDSAAVPQDTRQALPLPGRSETLGYLSTVRDRIVHVLEEREPSAEECYFILLSVFHEDMHAEAFLYSRQTLGYPPGLSSAGSLFSRLACPARMRARAGQARRLNDVSIPGGVFSLGSSPEEPFVFDNEKWAHTVEVAPFAIARSAVTQAEFAAFVEDAGYQRQELWCPEGWHWRLSESAEHPLYWQRPSGESWQRREFERWLALEADRPVVHVNWYEADAYCRWAGRRLPTEVEWEVAAAAEPDGTGRTLSTRKRRFPWGDEPPTPERACLDALNPGCAAVDDYPTGDSAFGCRQMIGNVWEWTASDFLPYPGFSADPYKEYSQPWFGSHKVLRGGCWATRARLLRNTWRNFFRPERRDIFAGFRTCGIEPSEITVDLLE